MCSGVNVAQAIAAAQQHRHFPFYVTTSADPRTPQRDLLSLPHNQALCAQPSLYLPPAWIISLILCLRSLLLFPPAFS